MSLSEPLRLGKVSLYTDRLETAGGQVVALPDVAAVHIEAVKASRAPGIAVAVVGALLGGSCLAAGGEGQAIWFVFGLGAVVIGLAMAALAHDRWLVWVVLSGGRRRMVVGSSDQEQAEAVAGAIRAVIDQE